MVKTAWNKVGSSYKTDTVWSVCAAIMCKVVECTEGEGVSLPIGGAREFQVEGIISMAVESMGHLENYK